MVIVITRTAYIDRFQDDPNRGISHLRKEIREACYIAKVVIDLDRGIALKNALNLHVASFVESLQMHI